MIYDGGAQDIPWVSTTSEHERFATERGKIERVFAKVKQRYSSLNAGRRISPSDMAKRWKAALIFSHLDHLAECDVCKMQGKPVPKDFVTLFS